jgi:hypothetical protein
MGFGSSASGGRSNDSTSGSSHYSLMDSSMPPGDYQERVDRAPKMSSAGPITSAIVLTQEKGALSTLKLVHQMMTSRWR